MPLPAIVGHEHVFDTFRRALRQGRLASTFLFVGPPGVGKWTAALALAQALLCESAPADALEACQQCPGCQQAAAQTHPDLLLVRKPEDKNFIPIELLIGDREHRMREGLCHDIALKPFRGARKIAIIDDADYLNQEGANCLLKTLEEPPVDSLIILIGTSQLRQLPTIRSRCQIIRFQPLSNAQVATVLAESQLLDEGADIAGLVERAQGSLRRALELSDPELNAVRRPLLEQLSQPDMDSVALAKYIHEHVEAAGKDAPPRRARLRQVVLEAAEFYRRLMRQLAGAATRGDALADEIIAAAAGRWEGRGVTASQCLERCLRALVEIDANANLATLTASWIDELAELSLPGK
jgi:DNA polymerase III subunit delta'